MRGQFYSLVMVGVLLALPPVLLAGKGYMGGSGDIVVSDDVSNDADTSEGVPDTIDGPLNNKGSNAGALFGDLYKIDRYQGNESADEITKYDCSYDDNNRIVDCELIEKPTVVGGEPILSVEQGVYAKENEDGSYMLEYAPFPSQCVQPVADYNKWGETRLPHNRLPLIAIYDAQWTRTECEVGELIGTHTISSTGDINTPDCVWTVSDEHPLEVTENCIDRYYIHPGDSACPAGVLWTDLVDEVEFGRLNLSRAPEAVLQAAFDEAITAINNADSISRDAAGRLLLTNRVYAVNDCGVQYWTGKYVDKAIDSPLENLALYVKLIKDGHLVTPGDERAPIDRSEKGGIPIWKLLQLTDGPSDALRPTVNIAKLRGDFPGLVDVSESSYYTYYECYDEGGAVVDCLGDSVESRELMAADACPANAFSCEGPWEGIKSTDANHVASEDDFDFAAAFLAAAADKTGTINVDMIVYLNSILGINKVVGYSAYNADGTPAADAIDYSRHPVYIDFIKLPVYDRDTVVGKTERGSGYATVLKGGEDDGTWEESSINLLSDGNVRFRLLGMDGETGLPTGDLGTQNILGFTQMADDNLSIIEFVHRYQIPELR